MSTKSLKVGSKAPAFNVKDDSGNNVKLSDFKGRTVVLYFYPKDMTPGCTIEAQDFNKLLPHFHKLKAVVLGVSRDSAERHKKFRDKCDLEFPLLVDEDGKLCEAYGVWTMKSFMGRRFMGIVRTTVVIDAAGKVAQIYPEVKVKQHAAHVLKDLSGGR